jgi:hypothetical protein
MKELDAITSRLRDISTLAELLDAGFDAFEAIRLVARACEDRAPDLFAAFMTAGPRAESTARPPSQPKLPPSGTTTPRRGPAAQTTRRCPSEWMR